MIEFLWPWALAFLPLPLLVRWLLPRARLSEPALQVPFYSLAAGYEKQGVGASPTDFLRRALMLVVWLALVAAALRPQWIGEPIVLPTSGRDLLLAVDISGSMGTKDMRLGLATANRLAVVKEVVGDFVERRQGDRLGLVLFGTHAYLQTPLTFDRNTVRSLLEETPVGIAGQHTAIGDAIGLAVKRLQSRPAEHRVLVLLTDGVNTSGKVSPILAAKLAAQEGIRIYTIGFGAEEMLVPGLLVRRRVNPSAELDEKTLTEIADMTGGAYLRARSTQELEQVYEALDELEPLEHEHETYRPVRALYWYPLALAFLLSLGLALCHPSLLAWGKAALAGLPRPFGRAAEEAAS